jgi:hypothetical protein
MIKLTELCKDYNSQPLEIRENLTELCESLNIVREFYAKPMRVTSGLRTMEDHLRIYKQKGITDKSRIPMKSQHLKGLAADISDPKGELQAWCLDHEDVLEEANLYCEDFAYTKNWVHFQTIPPKSGKRFFIP